MLKAGIPGSQECQECEEYLRRELTIGDYSVVYPIAIQSFIVYPWEDGVTLRRLLDQHRQEDGPGPMGGLYSHY